jgi:hypothetical protein
LRGVGVDVGHLTVGHGAQHLKDHHDIFGGLHCGHRVECTGTTLDDEHTRHAAQKLKRHRPMFVGVIPEGARGVLTGNVD